MLVELVAYGAAHTIIAASGIFHGRAGAGMEDFLVASWLFFVFMEHGDDFVAQRWCWRVSGADAISTTASKSFATLLACQADAANHGFTSSDQVTIDSQGIDRYGRRNVPHFGERSEAGLTEIE